MTVIGYLRVSSDKQTLEHQRFEIERFAAKAGITIDKWIAEKISSRKELAKRKLGDLLNTLQSDDILIACEISRLGRSLLEIMRILETCLNKNCQVWTLKENYRLGNDIQSKVLAFAFGLAAEIERKLISERTKASLANLKASGRKLGRPPSTKTKKLKLAKNISRLRNLLANGVSKTQIAKVFGVHRATLRLFIAGMLQVKENTTRPPAGECRQFDSSKISGQIGESRNYRLKTKCLKRNIPLNGGSKSSCRKMRC